MKAWRPPRSSFRGKVRYPDPINEGLEASQKAALKARYAIRTLLMKAWRPPRSSFKGKVRYPDPINEGYQKAALENYVEKRGPHEAKKNKAKLCGKKGAP